MTVEPQCFRCEHLDRAEQGRSGMLRCAAFPLAVPVPIQLDEHDHRRPYPGDRGIRFEAANEGGGGAK